jgi:hypothetical protein
VLHAAHLALPQARSPEAEPRSPAAPPAPCASTHHRTKSDRAQVTGYGFSSAAAGANEWDAHWDDLVPEGFSPRYEQQRDFLRPEQLEALLGRLGPDNAARAAFMRHPPAQRAGRVVCPPAALC